MWPFKEKLPYTATIELYGNHPYRNEPEFPDASRTIKIDVMAKDWNDASYKALDKIVRDPKTVTELAKTGPFSSAQVISVNHPPNFKVSV